MNITPNYQFKINSAITNNQSTPNFFGKQKLVERGITGGTKLALATMSAGTVLAMQNGKTAQDTQFTKQQIEEIFGNKEAFKLRTFSQENGRCYIYIDSEFGNKEYINLCTICCDENTNIVKNVSYNNIIDRDMRNDKDKEPFIVSIMENLSEDEQNLFFNSKLFDIERPKKPIETVKEDVIDAIQDSPGHLFYPLPDTHLVHSSDLINPNELKKMKFGDDYLLMVHNTHNPATTALVKKEGLKCYSDINPKDAALRKKNNYNNDPDLIYFKPLSSDYNIDEDCIVIAVRKGAGTVFNQEWRPAGCYEPYVCLCHKFNKFDCFGTNNSSFDQLFNGITVHNIPEICFADRHIPPEYFVRTSQLKAFF